MSRSLVTRRPPAFFAKVQADAQSLWEKLDGDPVLAGPWRQLFRQVQSPRHVLSELLQNADDAGATHATASIDGGVFIFEHDGEDFNEEQFESLCRFGFSNKRKLHTIGFRGIGFKSTFSLGSSVEVLTPTLAVRFDDKRFTDPVWMPDSPMTDVTRICVRIENANRQKELEKNLQEWANSPASLLFFQSIRKLTIFGQTIEQKVLGRGPVPGSEVIRLSAKESKDLVIFRSEEAPFPADAIAEIRQERGSEDIFLPPCQVELVFGLEGEQRLFVILPTDVRPSLPFSCNAPFIQDPARTGIKDPSISLTNCWLLKRLGALAASAMNAWLRNGKLPMDERAKAYALLPERGEPDDTVAGQCEQQVVAAFCEAVPQDRVLLAVDGSVTSCDNCIAPPNALYAVWTPDQLVSVFGKEGQNVLAAEVSAESRRRLEAWGWLRQISTADVARRLEAGEPIPKPDDWSSLVTLWRVAQQWAGHDWDHQVKRRMRIVPVEGSEWLLSSPSVVRLSTAKRLLSDDDWTFVTKRLKILDREWLNFLSQQKRKGTSSGQQEDPNDAARQFLVSLALNEPTSADELVARTYHELSQDKTVQLHDMVRLTHIIARLDVPVPKGLDYVTRDLFRRKVDDNLSLDLNGELEALLPDSFIQSHLLHADYSSAFRSCTRQQWESWIRSPKSGLRSFVGFNESQDWYFGYNISPFLKKRQCKLPEKLPIRTMAFKVTDFDFVPELLAHWDNLAKTDNQVWTKVVRLISEDPTASWVARSKAWVIQQSGNSSAHFINCGDPVATWVLRLRALHCLQDTHGFPHVPAELLMRTPQTETLLDVDPFVRAEMDIPATRDLLKLLGVRDTPASADKLIDRLRDLSTVQNAPLQEVTKWYGRLDQILPRCDSDELARIRTVFASERLILSAGNEWCSSGEVFQVADEQDTPDAAVVHPTVAHLSMWTRLGVPERPTVDLIIDWLKELESGQTLDAQDIKRVRAAQKRCPVRVWSECGHWLTLDNTWAPVSQISYRRTMQGLTKYGELFPGVRSKTADLSNLSADVYDQPPFNALTNLGDAIEHRITEVQQDLPEALPKLWLVALAQGLRRVKLPNQEQTIQVRDVACRLAGSAWQPFHLLKVTPYIAGTPAGQPFSPDVLWQDRTFYVRDGRPAKLFNAIADELARPFGLAEIGEAIRACMERDPAFVEEYLENAFTLDAAVPEDQGQQPATGTGAGEQPSKTPDPAGEPASAAADGADDKASPDTELDDQPGNGEDGVDDDQQEDDPENGPKRQQRERPPREDPLLIAVFAKLNGFRWDAEQSRFVHSDGSWMQRAEGTFSWEWYVAGGQVQCRYWVSEQCLANGGIEIGADLWELIDAHPSTSGLVLRGEDGHPQEFTGTELVRMKATGAIVLYPAKYRIRRGAQA